MIAESYVSFDTARMLKEAGFDVPTRKYYEVDDDGEVTRLFDHCTYDHNRFGYKEYSCPTQALAARWLREAHHYAICVWFSKDHEKWFYAHGDMDNMAFDTDYNISEFIYDSYEQALEAGLQKVIKLIRSKDYEEDNVQ